MTMSACGLCSGTGGHHYPGCSVGRREAQYRRDDLAMEHALALPREVRERALTVEQRAQLIATDRMIAQLESVMAAQGIHPRMAGCTCGRPMDDCTCQLEEVTR